MGSLEKLTRFKQKAASHQREADKAAGALERVQEQLSKQFECSTLQEAEELLEKLQGQEQSTQKKFKKGLSKFEEKWSDVLDEN